MGGGPDWLGLDWTDSARVIESSPYCSATRRDATRQDAVDAVARLSSPWSPEPGLAWPGPCYPRGGTRWSGLGGRAETRERKKERARKNSTHANGSTDRCAKVRQGELLLFVRCTDLLYAAAATSTTSLHLTWKILQSPPWPALPTRLPDLPCPALPCLYAPRGSSAERVQLQFCPPGSNSRCCYCGCCCFFCKEGKKASLLPSLSL